MFEENPCRWNLFEVFQIDRSVTDLKALRERVGDTRDLWKHHDGKVTLRSGEVHEIEEARLNDLAGRLFNPLLRLQEEQFAHQFHSFAGDDELLGAVKALAQEAAPLPAPTVASAVLVSAIGPLLPTLSPPRLEDNLPWPDPPAPLPVEREKLEDAILRDC